MADLSNRHSYCIMVACFRPFVHSQGYISMTVFDTLLAPIMPILQQIEAGRKKHHNEAFLWIDFVRVLVFYFTKRCGSRNALIVALENADPALALPHVL